MTHETFMNKINAITARGIAYANAHAEEIAAAQANAGSDDKINAILADAERAVKGSWAVYESFKTQISAVASSAQYESAIIRLTRVLGV